MENRNIFVFGSNTQGRHGKGAALSAVRMHGAIYGQARGLQGNAYAIVTKELRKDKPPVHLNHVLAQVKSLFLPFAREHPEMTFNVTAIGCGLAGFKPSEIAPLFEDSPDNVKLPGVFREILYINAVLPERDKDYKYYFQLVYDGTNELYANAYAIAMTTPHDPSDTLNTHEEVNPMPSP
jgi:hypothetical protein